jgi:hypothetical protein
MNRLAEWQIVLDAEMKRWSAMTCESVISELSGDQVYEVEVGFKKLQVEVELLENTETYLQVGIAVDDGTIPWSFVPLTGSFILQKGGTDKQ